MVNPYRPSQLTTSDTYGERPRPLFGDAALLIGDAAGLAYSRSGEGILPAIESGLFAAQTILEADGRYDRDRLAAHERRIVARFGSRRTTFGITNLLPHWVAGPIAGRLFRSAWFIRHVVLDRWFLHAHQQPPGGERLEIPSRIRKQPDEGLEGVWVLASKGVRCGNGDIFDA